MADPDVEEHVQARLRRSRETLAMMHVVTEDPSDENIIAFHELHARHLRELGQDERAERADERARAVRDAAS